MPIVYFKVPDQTKSSPVGLLVLVERTGVRISLLQVVELAQVQPFRILVEVIGMRIDLSDGDLFRWTEVNFFIQVVSPECLVVAVTISGGSRIA